MIFIKRIIAAVAALALLMLTFGCSGESGGLSAGYDPAIIALLEGGRDADGFVDDLAVTLSGRLNGELTSLKALSPEDAAAAFKNGELDYYLGIPDTCDPELWCSETLLTIDTLAVESGSVSDQTLEGRSAVSVVGSASFEAASQSDSYLLISQVMLCSDPSAALAEVTAGGADIALLDEVNARALTEVSGYEYTIHSKPVYSAPVAVIAPQDSEYIRSLTRAVRWLSRRGRLADISVSTLGADITA